MPRAGIQADTAAETIGTTILRVSFFMNRSRGLGFIEYGDGGMRVHTGQRHASRLEGQRRPSNSIKSLGVNERQAIPWVNLENRASVPERPVCKVFQENESPAQASGA